jgi:hypothetical protein
VGDRTAALADGVVVAVLAHELVVGAAGLEVALADEPGGDQRVERPVDGGRVHRRSGGAGVRQRLLGGDVAAVAQRLEDQQALGSGPASGATEEGGGGSAAFASLLQPQLDGRSKWMVAVDVVRGQGGGPPV